MKATSIDVYIYDTSNGLHKFASDISKQLEQLSGVINASVNAKVRGLLAVRYEPDKISALKILNALRENGHSGSLVGM